MAVQLLCSSDCPVWSNGRPAQQCAAQLKLKSTLRDVFDHECFRPGQLEAVLAVAHGKDTFVRIATGGENQCACTWCHLPLVQRLWVLSLVH